jgi:5-methylcytosine-specific restriction protein A
VLPCQGGCGGLVRKSGKCPACKGRADRQRERPHHHLYNAAWRKESKLFLRVHPICAGLPDGKHAFGCSQAATLVDHITPHRGDASLFWDPQNWQPMSKRCHDVKTVQYDGGFGNERKNAA